MTAEFDGKPVAIKNLEHLRRLTPNKTVVYANGSSHVFLGIVNDRSVQLLRAYSPLLYRWGNWRQVSQVEVTEVPLRKVDVAGGEITYESRYARQEKVKPGSRRFDSLTRTAARLRI